MVSYKRQHAEIHGRNIKDKKDTDIVLVNKARLYATMSLAMRGIDNVEEREKIVRLQNKCLARTRTGREMFTPMTVKEIKVSFGKQLEKMPYNTFIEVKNSNHVNLIGRVHEG